MMTSYDSATKCFSGQGMRSVFLGNHMNWGETGLPYFLAMTCVDCLPSPNDRAVIRSLVAPDHAKYFADSNEEYRPDPCYAVNAVLELLWQAQITGESQIVYQAVELTEGIVSILGV